MEDKVETYMSLREFQSIGRSLRGVQDVKIINLKDLIDLDHKRYKNDEKKEE